MQQLYDSMMFYVVTSIADKFMIYPKPLKLKEISNLCCTCLKAIAPLIYDSLIYSLFNCMALVSQN